ncbi:MAG TPA: acyl-CoA dehydrogenase family protein [Mycobacteriales bacterium]|jgi:alkylation response protein AidB-like acyl-CoA dehydrogenase|nr:acyl-CoA dehydrogenase family protein [Mycobacteriales bacterium]
MQLDDRLEPVLKIARDNAAYVDRAGEYPAAAVDALRSSGLLGLTLPEDVGGLGGGPVELVEVLSALAGACGSTAMIYLMHVSAAMSVAAAPPAALPDVVEDLAAGRALGTLAFSETASRSHFWAPMSRAVADGDGIRLRVDKSWVTSAGRADVYVVSTGSVDDNTAVDVYAVPAAAGAQVTGTFTGMGLRGNGSAPMAFDVDLPPGHRLGAPGSGFGLMTDVVMPWFNLGNAAVSIGLAGASVDAAVAHCTRARLEHVGSSLAELPTVRARLARMSLALGAQRAYLAAAAASIAAPTDETGLYVLGVKAAANDAALTITDEALRVCGGAAYSAQLGVDRHFRDARAGHVMAPTADVLYDLYGKAITGQPLF